MKDFAFFVKRRDVKTQRPDRHLAAATYREGTDRLAFAASISDPPKYILENAYEAMREAADALLYMEGYKSYSHEASILFLLKKGIDGNLVREIDRFRMIRNNIKYYGGDCTSRDAQDALRIARMILPKIGALLGDTTASTLS